MTYSLWGQATAPEIESFSGELAAALERRGFAPAEDALTLIPTEVASSASGRSRLRGRSSLELGR